MKTVALVLFVMLLGGCGNYTKLSELQQEKEKLYMEIILEATEHGWLRGQRYAQGEVEEHSLQNVKDTISKIFGISQ